MGYFSSTETYTFQETQIDYSSVTTGDSQLGRQLLYQLKMSIRKANKIDIIVSFLMTSGVRLLMEDFSQAIERGAKIRILTGNYLNITQPEALYLVRQKLGQQVELRMYQDTSRSFHPKSYIFEFDNCRTIFVGSSNISRSALTSGIEWNYSFQESVDPENFQRFTATFEELWQNHAYELDDEKLAEYSKHWHKPAVYKDMQPLGTEDEKNNVQLLYEPRGAQIEALYSLDRLREEGGTKGIVQAATGIGKTFLAAFDSRGFNRILFVAHREEILKQAMRSFDAVQPQKSHGFFMDGFKESDADMVFASVATLGRDEYLSAEYFSRDYFDYIVIDEFHHAVNNQYRKIIEYFQPKFLLGLTATPERMDGRDIFSLCDYNVPYEISLAEGINKGMLVPFHYYGIYDDTDYNKVDYAQGKYSIASLNRAYASNKRRNELILANYLKYRRRQALGFCCSREHAENMAGYFCQKGVKAAAVYSGDQGQYAMERNKALKSLQHGGVEILFTVDMFNEGVDIKALDLVLFLRPTESPIVFLQQLGRGLRLSRGKQYLIVLDFIGNYVKADRVQKYLTSDFQNGYGKGNKRNYQTSDSSDYPDDCQVDFDIRLIDMWHRLEKRNLTKQAQIQAEFQKICDELGGRHPSRLELFNAMDQEIYQLCLSVGKENPFKDYLGYLVRQQCLTEEEQRIYDSYGRDFLNWLETTDMTKVYKMPVLSSFLKDGKIKSAVSRQEVLHSWKSFFAINRNWRDLPQVVSYQEYLQKSDKWHNGKIEAMPVKFLRKSGIGFVKHYDVTDKVLLEFTEEVQAVLSLPGMYQQMQDVLNYRVQHYYWRRYRGLMSLRG